MAVGAFGLAYITKHVGRSSPAVYSKIAELYGGGGISRGTLSLQETAERTGYDPKQLQRAGRALGQRWQRTSSKGRVMLSDDQVEAHGKWLSHDYWCSRARTYACAYCGRNDGTPKGVGLCKSCYDILRKQFVEAGLPFGAEGLLSIVRQVRGAPAPEFHDWLEAFEASLEEGCILTRGTLDRLFLEARRDSQHERSLPVTDAHREGARLREQVCR